MRERTLGLLAVSFGILGVATWVNAQSKSSPLEGAWMVQQITYAKPPANPVNKPTGLVQFVGNHYSLQVLNNGGRPDFGPGGQDTATADQLRATWGPFASNAGTFTVTGNTIRYTRLIAKNPAVMAPGNWSEDTFMVNGDTLVLTATRNNNGPVENPQTTRLTRAK